MSAPADGTTPAEGTGPAQSAPRPDRGRGRGWWLPAWSLVMALLVLAPTMRPGFTLSYDMVFTPRQPLVPDAFGLGSAAPRAVPVDALLGLVTAVVPGQVVQKAVLLALLVAAGWGAGRLVPTASILVRCATASLFVWNAYVAERLVLGHWSLLVAYALVPWAVLLALGVRGGRRGALPGLVAVSALAAITAGGGLLVLLTVTPVLAWPGGSPDGRPWRRLGWFLAGWVVVDAPWWLPGLLQSAPAVGGDGGVHGFAARPDQPLGVLGSLLGLGGAWNAEVVPGSRGLATAAAFTVLAVAAAVLGWRPLRDRWGRAASGLLLAAVLGVGLAAAGSYAPGVLGWVVVHVPGGGLLRDGQRLVAPWAVLLSVAAPLGVERLARRAGDATVRRLAVSVVVVLPLLVMPDLAWGAAGRLTAVTYPSDWDRVRTALADDPAGGDVAVLPWQPFRRFGWNGDRTVLDPAPRYLTRVTVVSRDLTVSTVSTGSITILGDDPRSAAVGAALATGRPATSTLPPLGVGWLLVERGTPGPVDPAVLAGATPAYDGTDLVLYRLGPATGPGWPASTPWVLTVDALALALALGCTAAAVRARRARVTGVTGHRSGALPAATVAPPDEPREGPWELS